MYQGVRYSNHGVASIAADVVAEWTSTRANRVANNRSMRSRPAGPTAARKAVTGLACAMKNGTTYSSSNTCSARTQNRT